jgi:predicted transcriptional regulator
MTLLEVNYVSTLQDQFNKVGRRKHRYKFIDCTSAVISLENHGSAEWAEFMQRVIHHAETMKIDVLATPVEFNRYELAQILGKKGIHIPLG